jgi:hypothetical protein
MYDVLKNGLGTLDKPSVAIAAKLGWGLLHGLGFGAGLGAVLALWQHRSEQPADSIANAG